MYIYLFGLFCSNNTVLGSILLYFLKRSYVLLLKTMLLKHVMCLNLRSFQSNQSDYHLICYLCCITQLSPLCTLNLHHHSSYTISCYFWILTLFSPEQIHRSVHISPSASQFIFINNRTWRHGLQLKCWYCFFSLFHLNVMTSPININAFYLYTSLIPFGV